MHINIIIKYQSFKILEKLSIYAKTWIQETKSLQKLISWKLICKLWNCPF